MKSKVHPRYKTKYRVANWAAYNQALVRRGDVTVWLSSEAIAAWTPRRSGQRWYSDLAIETALSVSNSLSGRHWELDQVPAVGDPTDIVQFGTGHRVAAGEGQRRVALQRRMAAHLVVVGLEVGKFPFKITGIPEQHMVETFSPRRSDQALHEWVGPGTCGTVLIASISRIRRFAVHRCASNSGS